MHVVCACSYNYSYKIVCTYNNTTIIILYIKMIHQFSAVDQAIKNLTSNVTCELAIYNLCCKLKQNYNPTHYDML